MKRFALYTAVALATLLVLFVFWQLRLIIFFFVLSLFIAAVIRPAIDYVDNLGLPRTAAQILLYVLILVGMLLPLYLSSNILAENAEQLLTDSQSNYKQLYSEWSEGTAMQQYIAAQLPKPAEMMSFIPGLRPDTRMWLFGITQSMSTVVSGLTLALVLSVYWSASRVRFERLWLSLLPSEKRKTARQVWREMETQLGRYIGSQFLQSIMIGIFLGAIFWISGVPYATLLVLFASLAKFIPLIGAFVTLSLVFFAGLNISWEFARLTALITAVVLHFIWLFVARYLFPYRRYSSMLIILLVIPFVEIFGILGFVFAPPFAVAVQLLLAQWFILATQTTSQKSVEINALKERLAQLKSRSLAENEEPSSELNSLIQRLEKLLNDPVIEAKQA